MKPIDFKKDLKALYDAKPGEPSLVNVPAFPFLMVDGKGDPNSPEFQQAVQALYGVAFTIKFALKFAGRGPQYSVPPLEGLWWVSGKKFSWTAKRSLWRWTAMIMQPSHVTKADVTAALKKLVAKRPSPALKKIKLETFKEGLCVQIMHVGPYSGERKTIELLEAFVKAKGYRFTGKHHELYLGDPRRTAPAKLRTILRHPVTR